MKFTLISAYIALHRCLPSTLAFVSPAVTYKASSPSATIYQTQYDPAHTTKVSPIKASAQDEQMISSEPIPDDPARTTPQLLWSVWEQIVEGCKLSKGESNTVIYPKMVDRFNNEKYMNRLLAHFDACKDNCDDFGVNTILTPYTEDKKIIGFTVKSYKDRNLIGTYASDGDLEFAPDPFFDNDDWDSLEAKIRAAALEDAMDDDDDELEIVDLPEIVDKVPDDDDKITTITKAWVNKMMSDMGICPFTNGAEKAGLPMGNVFYTVERTSNVEEMYARYWKEVVRVEQNPEKELSTTLLVIPNFMLDNVEMFEHFSDSLTQPLESLQIENLLQLVFFHPEWSFRDGRDRNELGRAANYARRSPWPMINILRTKQVRAAQRGIPTGLVYQQNEKILDQVGTPSLEKMLRLRDWSDIADLKVDRKDMEALRVAQDLQTTGVVADEDKSIIHDVTPAANRVDKEQVEGGNIINVILQAVEKRITQNEDGAFAALSAPETSAAMMASDVLLDHLDKLEAEGPKRVIPVNAMAAQYFDTSDEDTDDEGNEHSAMFGGGIM